MFDVRSRCVKSGATDDVGDASPAAAVCDRETDDMHHIPRCLVLGTVFLRPVVENWLDVADVGVVGE